jgi:hypothetical protein
MGSGCREKSGRAFKLYEPATVKDTHARVEGCGFFIGLVMVTSRVTVTWLGAGTAHVHGEWARFG